MADLFRLSASEAAARIREGKLTSEALVRSCLERIDSRESQVKAWVHLDRDFALAQARECDRSASRGPIHGVPFAAKDIMDTADLPTEYGSPIYKGNRPAADAACVALSRAAGGVLLGKTVTTEFASRSPLGNTTNPHNPAHTPGGSSSGSAAAVADFMVPLAFGTQTVGSVIRPAAFCGCVGYKPSYGEVSTQGVKQNTASFDTVGLFARAVEDLALFRAAVTGFAAKPLAAIPVNELKIGFCRTMFWDRAEEYTKTFLEEAASALAKAGAKVSDFDLGKPFEQFEAMGRRINDYEFSRGLTWERNHHWNLLSEFQRDKLAGMAQCLLRTIPRGRSRAGSVPRTSRRRHEGYRPAAHAQRSRRGSGRTDQYGRYLVQYPVDVDLYSLRHVACVYRTVRSAGRHSAHRSPKPGSPSVGRGPGCVPGVLEINMRAMLVFV